MKKNLSWVRKGFLVVLSCIWLASAFPPLDASAYDASVPTLRSDQDVAQYLLSNSYNSGSSKFSKSSFADQPRLFKKNVDSSGRSHYIYQQAYQGIPIYGKYANVTLDSHLRLNYVKNEFSTDNVAVIDTTDPSLSSEEAIQALVATVQNEEGYTIDTSDRIEGLSTYQSTAELIIYPFGYKTYLAYEVKLGYLFPQTGSWVGYVDAITGEVIDKYSKLNHLSGGNARVGSGSGYYENYTDLNVYVDTAKEFSNTERYYLIDTTKAMFSPVSNSFPFDEGVIWTLQFEDENRSTIVTSATDEFRHPDGADAHYNTGLAYDFYSETFGRRSFDNEGSTVTSIVYDTENNNAAYVSGIDVLLYGRGTGVAGGGMDCVPCSRDIAIHEFTHAVTQYTAGLEYRNQSGALNESISDIMAAVADEDGDEWLIGEETGRYVRNMANPSDPSLGSGIRPDHMDQYQSLPSSYDNGGVHINTGIPNKAAYLIATKVDNLNIPGLKGRPFLGQITYGALTKYLFPTAEFKDARDAFIAAASDYVYGSANDVIGLSDSQKEEVVQKVKEAWAEVGLPADHDGQASITSFLVDQSSKDVPPIINELLGAVAFYVPYGTDVSSIKPTIEVSENADYFPKDPINFNNSQRVRDVTVTGPSNVRVWRIYAVEEPILNYSTRTFMESQNNDGSISNVIDTTLLNHKFSGYSNVQSNFTAEGKVRIHNVPTGLTATAIKISDTTVRIVLSGKASAHANANDIHNLQVEFMANAFSDWDGFWLRQFQLIQIKNANMNLSIDFNNPAGGGGFGGFGGGFIPPANSEIALKLDPAAGIIIAPPDVNPTTTADGQSKLTYVLDGDDLKKGFELLKESTMSNMQIIRITVEQDSDLLEVKLPASAIRSGASSSPDAKVVIESGTASYELPVSLLQLDQLAKQLGVTIENLTVSVSLNKVSGASQQAMSASASNSKLQLVGDAIDFTIAVSSGTKRAEVNDFGGTSVERSIMVPGQLSTATATALRYNPEAGRFTFVPAQFQVIGNKTKVTLKWNSNSIYTVAKYTRIFTDVSSHWASDDITFLASRSIVSGYTETDFAPNRTITRAEFAAILTRALGLSSTGEKSNFSDVQASAWYADAVTAAVNAKLASGYEDDTFRPGMNISREQMAVMIANALHYMQQQSASSSNEADGALAGFTDADDISSWARSAVAAAAEAKIISGFSDGSFQPSKNATRAEAAVMIRRLLDKLGLVNHIGTN